MTYKIALASVLIMAIIVPTIIPSAYSMKSPTEENWYHTCNNKLNDDKFQFADYSCYVDIYKMWNDIVSLFDRMQSLENKISSLEGKNNYLEYRLQILEGTIEPPDVSLTLNVSPEIITGDERFLIWGTANRMDQDWVDFEIYNPDGEIVQRLDLILLQGGGYFPVPVYPNYKWTTSGNYTIHAIHGEHETVIKTIQYHLGE